MASQRFLIAPFKSGLETDVSPWLLPEDAFQELRNMYVFRGRVRKRFGSTLVSDGSSASTPETAQLNSRLRINIGTTNSSGNTAMPLTVPGARNVVGQMFSCGNIIFTVYQDGATYVVKSTGATTATGTYNFGAHTFDIGGSDGDIDTASVFFYPAEPVMGITQYQLYGVNDEPTYVFDRQFSYQFTGGGWNRLGTAVWTGSDSEFFWSTTWHGASSDVSILFTTNFNDDDGIKYFISSGDWTNYKLVLNGTMRIQTARVVLPFKDRLVFLNTVENQDGASIGTSAAGTGNFNAAGIAGATMDIGQVFLIGTNMFTVISDTAGAQAMEVQSTISVSPAATGTFDVTTATVAITGNGENVSTTVYFLPNTGTTLTRYGNRCRFTQNGSPLQSNTLLEAAGKGGFLDAPTKEEIVSAEFLKDRLIVFFERSTWELVYTGNQTLPFKWQQINTELGAESTFSIVPFDKIVLGIGDVGIHACNGANVTRIDSKIPDFVFNIHNDNDGTKRVAGIRDYDAEVVYWTLPSDDNDDSFPTQVLVYNYATKSWAINDDSITTFGYFQNNDDITWQDSLQTWEESDFPWNSGALQKKHRSIIGGNQQGWVFFINGSDINTSTRNAGVLQITAIDVGNAILTVVNHNIKLSEYIAIENCQGATPADTIAKVTKVDGNDITVDTIFTGAYTGAGTVARVSNPSILTKQYNFFVKEGRDVEVTTTDFYVEKTSSGEVSIDYFASSMSPNTGMGNNGLGTVVLETRPYDPQFAPLEQNQSELWHRVYLDAEGSNFQIRMYLSDTQIRDASIAWSNIVIHAIMFHASPTRSRLE